MEIISLMTYCSSQSVCTSQLRCLCLVCCYYFTDKKLSELAAKLPLLEDLDTTISSLSEEPLKALKAFGRYCPLLKSLKWNQLWDGQPRIRIEGDEEFDDDDEALAIAKNMPELHHLRLNGNRVTNDGLQAILNGCPHLESLKEIWEKDVLNVLKTCGIPMIPLMTTESWQKFLIMDHLMKMTFFFFLRGDEDDLGDFYFD